MGLINIVLIISIQFWVISGTEIDSIDPNKPCPLNQFCYLKDFMGYECMDFKSLVQLNSSNCALRTVKYIHLYFPDNTVLDSHMNVIVDLINQADRTPSFLMSLEYLQGIDLDTFASLVNTTTSVQVFANPASLELFWGTFNLYYKKEPILTQRKCSVQTYQVLLNRQGVNVLAYFSQLVFNGIVFKQRLCKHMFRNLTLDRLAVLIHLFKFEIDVSSLNTNISLVFFSKINKFYLNEEYLDPEVFKNTQSIELYELSLYKIQQDLFRDRFLSIRSVYFNNVNNIRGFFHETDSLGWMKYLNFNQPSVNFTLITTNKTNDLKKSIIQIKINVINAGLTTFGYWIYQFPDEDFCLFIQIPLDKLVLIQIEYTLNKTCTIAWLYRYESFYPSLGLMPYNVSHELSSCNFTHLLAQCQMLKEAGSLYKDDPYIALYDLSQTINQAKIVLLYYMRPIVACFGLITNLLIVMTILYNQKRRRKIQSDKNSQEIVLLEQNLYKYILINSVLNSLYTLMHLLDSLIPCTPHIAKLNPSLETDNCVVKDTWLGVTDSILKLMSNFTYLQISLNRYLLVGKNHWEPLIKMSRIKMKTFLASTGTITLALSSVVYFQISMFYIKNDGSFQCNGGYTNYFYCNIYIYWFSNYYQTVAKSYIIDSLNVSIQNILAQLPIISALTIIHDLFSYFLFCIFSLILDILTVKKLHDALKEKEKVKGKSERRKNRESERRSIMMIVANSLVNFILRAPELLSVTFFYIVIHNQRIVFQVLCFDYDSCLVLLDFSKVFYITSICFNLFFFVKFNSVFRCSFLIFIQSGLKLFKR